jgi:hypothetical protein
LEENKDKVKGPSEEKYKAVSWERDGINKTFKKFHKDLNICVVL